MTPLLVTVPARERPSAETMPGTYHTAAKTQAAAISTAPVRWRRVMCLRVRPEPGRGGPERRPFG